MTARPARRRPRRRGERRTGQHTGQPDAVCERRLAMRARNRSANSGLRSSGPTSTQSHLVSASPASASMSRSWPLWGQRADAQASGHRRVRHRRGRHRAGRRARGRVDGKPAKHQLARPLAGDHDTGGRAEHGLLRPLRRRVALSIERGGQRHVQQHHQSQAPRMGEQRGGGRRGDQAVDQRRLAVRDWRDRRDQVGAGAAVARRPRSGDGGDAHVPSGLGQPGAHPPVVDVAAARAVGIVEPLRRHHVHPQRAGPVVQSARS